MNLIIKLLLVRELKDSIYQHLIALESKRFLLKMHFRLQLQLHGHKRYFDYQAIDYRIPFILKMAGQKETITYQPAFNTYITSNLVLAILKNDVSTVSEVVSWLNKNKTNPIIKY